MKRHDHRQSLWAIAGGTLLWCYQCGAWTRNVARLPGERGTWHKPTGLGGPNPAMHKADKSSQPAVSTDKSSDG